jgi:hypothetical protein
MGTRTNSGGLIGAIVRLFSGSTRALTRAVQRKPVSRLTDRILSDALRIAELPSPSEREEKRVAFVMQRMGELGVQGSIDHDGNVMARLPVANPVDPGPLLLFADLGTNRWHPLGSLAHVNQNLARGAGIADSLGVAAIISIVEGVIDGSIRPSRDLLVLFAARSMDDPRSAVFARIVDDPASHPAAALGVRGLGLGALAMRAVGTSRISIQVRMDDPAAGTTSSAGEGAINTAPRTAVSVVAAVAQRLGGIRWDAEGSTACRIRRILAGTGFGRFPTEGLIDIELESADAAVLDMAMKAVVATAETIGRESNAQLTANLVGHIPVGDPTVSASLRALCVEIMRSLHIRQSASPGADPAAFLSTLGIPAISIACAEGREGLESDEVDIASLETGQTLLVEMIQRIDAVRESAETGRKGLKTWLPGLFKRRKRR